MAQRYLFSYTLEQQDDGRWSAVCNELPGVATYGHDKVDAITQLNDAIAGAIHVYEAKGWPIPGIMGASEIGDQGIVSV